jgi:hypothetical protein
MNYSVCENIEDANYREYCIIRIKISTTKNHSLCENLENQFYKDKCYWLAAQIKEDYTLCYNIVNQDSLYACLAFLKNDITICEDIENKKVKSDCYYSFLFLEKDPDLCENENILNEWQDICYFDIAVSKVNKSMCNNIKDRGFREYCIKRIKYFS